MKPTVLAIDDEVDLLTTYQLILKKNFNLLTSSSGATGLEIIKQKNPDVVLLDIRMPDWSGIQTLQEIKKFDESLDVIMVTASQELKIAIDSMKKGAYDFIVKPFDVNELIKVINNAVEKKHLLRENLYLKDSLHENDKYQQLIGQSAPMSKVRQTISTVASTKSTVLITGESGTGKELVARAIHAVSPRAKNPYVIVNCASIPENLLESTLFGHEAGAFTGADARKLGKFEIANHGTIFLDEIGCMSLSMQAKLLRVLQESVIERVGSTTPIEIDIRVIAATNASLEDLVHQGKFRDDLFYRLNVIPIVVPPLRHRKDDLNLLVRHFIQRFNRELHKNITSIEKEALVKMQKYDWPGNIRELQNLVERAVVLAKNGSILAININLPNNGGVTQNSNFQLACQSFEKELLEKTLAETKGNQSRAASLLGIHRTTLISKMKTLGIKTIDPNPA